MADEKPGVERFDAYLTKLRTEVVVLHAWHHTRPSEGKPACRCIGPFGTINLKLEAVDPTRADVADVVAQLRAQAGSDYIACIWHDESGVLAYEPCDVTGRFLRRPNETPVTSESAHA